LVIVGTDDVIVPTANSLVIAGKIAGVWLVQIKEAGRLLMHQYPEQFSSILRTFLSTA
jgi:pimeloyl-ACP methyl ester carboxylesterase